MPLLHKAPYSFKTVPQTLSPEDEVFHIPATKEVFKSYDEYIAKQQLYTKEVWSCALTGKSGLTLEEALELETTTRAKLDTFPTMLEKPTLLLAHHSNKNLDWMASTLSAEFKLHCVSGELVNLQHQGSQHVGKVQEFLTALDADEEDEQYSYKVQLSTNGETLQNIPHSSIVRKICLPSKELIKMFIREHTTKSSNMFNVKKDMLVKYSIPHKFASITSVLRCPVVGDVPGKKKPGNQSKTPSKTPSKSSNKTPSSANKSKTKTPSSGSKDAGLARATDACAKSLSLFTNKAAPGGPKMIKIHSVGADGKLITTWKSVPSKPVIVIDSDEESAPATANSPSPKASPAKAKRTPLTDDQKLAKKQRRVENKEVKEFTAKVQTLAEKYILTKDTTTSTATPTKMKQTTLNFSNKEKISNTIREIINAEDNGHRRSMIINDLAKSLTDNVSNKLPLATPVKSLLLEKREKLLEKDKLAKMSPAKRTEYFKVKEEMRIAMLQKKREDKMAEQQRLKEDRQKEREAERERARLERLNQMHLQKIVLDDLALEDLIPLPEYSPLELGEGYTAHTLPQVALIGDVVSNFRSVFVHEDDDVSYTADFLLQAAQGGCRGHRALSNLLKGLLQLLVQESGDKVKVDDLDVGLGTVDLTEYNIGCCVRSYLRSMFCDEELENVCTALEEQEFYQLPPSHKILIIYTLCEEVIKSKTFMAAVQENIEKVHVTRRILQTEQIEKNKRIAAERLADLSHKFKSSLGGVVSKDDDSDDCKIVEEEGEGDEGTTTSQSAAILALIPQPTPDEGIGSEEEDISSLASTVRQRREEIKKRKLEEAEEKIRRDAEKEKERKFREQQALITNAKRKEESLRSEIETLRSSIRNDSLGQDRHHNRYWIFNGCPGLYVERGWWSEQYFMCLNSSGASDDSGINDKQQFVVPEQATNEWFVVPSLAHYDSLKNSLSKRGVREKALLAQLNREDDKIRTSIRKYNYPSKTHRFLGNEEQSGKELKKDILTMDQSLAYAGLGGDEGVARLLKPDLCSMEMCKEALLAVQVSVEPKYMKKPLASVYNPSELVHQYNERVEVWIRLVLNAKTFSQLHTLLSVFDNCIQWEKTIANVKCKACKKQGDEKKLLICDVCDTGYHCGCLRPPLRKVPEDEWQCPSCRPSQEEDSSDSGECSDEGEESGANDDMCCVCEYGGELLLCDKCPSAYHLTCHDPPLKRIPRGDWACYSCINATVDVSSSSEEEEAENCAICSKGGKMVLCTECEQAFHMKCHDPPLNKIPNAKWQCSWCKGPEREEKESKKEDKEKSKKEEKESKKRASSSKGRAGKKRKLEAADKVDEREERPSKSSTSRTRRNSTVAEEENRAQRNKRRSLKRGVGKDLEMCEELIADLLKIPQSADFIDLVDKKKVPDYYELIERPVCLSEIRERTLYLQYEDCSEFVTDVTTLIANCYSYNLESSEVYENCQVLEKSFMSMLKSRLPNEHKKISKSR